MPRDPSLPDVELTEMEDGCWQASLNGFWYDITPIWTPDGERVSGYALVVDDVPRGTFPTLEIAENRATKILTSP
jgi:hypothetical protein